MYARPSKIGEVFLGRSSMATACYLINHSPHTTLKFKSPQEVWYNTLVNYSNLTVFNFPAYILVNEEKLEPRARKYIFMGYRAGLKGYRVWCNESKRIITFRDIVFDENSMLVFIVEKPLNNDVVIDAHEEV